jgi:hypothetical protein
MSLHVTPTISTRAKAICCALAFHCLVVAVLAADTGLNQLGNAAALAAVGATLIPVLTSTPA